MKKALAKLNDFQRWFNRYVQQGYGKKCPDFTWSCAVGHAYFVKELVDDFIEDTVATEKWVERQKASK